MPPRPAGVASSDISGDARSATREVRPIPGFPSEASRAFDLAETIQGIRVLADSLQQKRRVRRRTHRAVVDELIEREIAKQAAEIYSAAKQRAVRHVLGRRTRLHSARQRHAARTTDLLGLKAQRRPVCRAHGRTRRPQRRARGSRGGRRSDSADPGGEPASVCAFSRKRGGA